MTLFRLIICAILIPVAAFPGQRPDSLSRGTSNEERIQILDPGISTGRHELLFPSSLLRDQLFQIPLVAPPNRASGYPEPFLVPAVDMKLDLLMPIRAELSAQGTSQSISVALGTAEMAGVAYVMYQHVKKYGLFK